MSKCLICSKKRVICSFAHFWWVTWAICWHRSFLVSNLSNLLTLLVKKEGTSKSLVFLNLQKIWFYSNIFKWIIGFLWAKERFTQKNHAIRSGCHKRPKRFAHGCSFLVNFWWAEQFAHSCSFVISDLSKLLTVTL